MSPKPFITYGIGGNHAPLPNKAQTESADIPVTTASVSAGTVITAVNHEAAPKLRDGHKVHFPIPTGVWKVIDRNPDRYKGAIDIIEMAAKDQGISF
jgi:hypothetical protein